MIIPKIIHYCWFGGNQKPEIIEKCIDSWKKSCPGWEIIEWNESNYDVNAHQFTADAYAAKKWAFVSDVARLEAIIQYGGIYLDTDVELLSDNPFEDLQNYENLLVFETERAINTGLCFGGCRDSELCRSLLDPYLNTRYTADSVQVNSIANKPVFLSRIPELKWDGQTQIHGNTYIMGIDEYSKQMRHYGTRSWCNDLPDYKISGCWKLKKFLRNPKIFTFLENKKLLKKTVPFYTFMVYDFLDLGPVYYLKRAILKIRNKRKK